MIKANDLYLKLKAIECLIRQSENPDGSCDFDMEKVYIFLETAESQIQDKLDNPKV